jgi:hypothetical protein
MENMKTLPEPLRISNSGKYELYDYFSSKKITISGALLLNPYFENNLNTTIKIVEKESQREFDRFMLMAFRNPNQPEDDKIKITGKFFNPKKYYIKVEPKNSRDEVLFLLYFSEES